LFVTLTMLGVNTGLFWLFHVQAGLAYLLAQVFATSLVVVMNFQINRRYTFNHYD
jgi:putative flippase GtrA